MSFEGEINEQKSPSQDAEESNEPIIRIRGMPWSATEKDVVKFFGDITVRGGTEGVNMVLSREGRASGEAYLELENLDDMERALKKNNQNMGHRYIELFRATRSEMEWVLKRQYGGPESPQDGCVRLRGLPFGCTKEEVANFFTGLEIVPNGINLVADFSGRSTGEAYVQFANDESAEKALEKHKEKIGHRYIEIFRSSLSEMKSAMVSPKMRGSGSNRPAPYDSSNRFGGANRFGGGGGRGGRMSGGSGGGGGGMRGKRGGVNDWGYGNDGWGGRGRVDSLGSGMGSRGGSSGLGGSGGYGGVGGMGSRGGGGSNWKSTGHVIRMRGLPFRATDADIKDFFKPLLPVSVHLDHNDSGKPTGEADVEFATYEDALRAMTKDRETMAHRYIELFIVGDGPSGGGGNSGGAPRLMNSGRSGGSNGNYGSGGNSVFSGGYDY